jgi:thioredoxin 1
VNPDIVVGKVGTEAEQDLAAVAGTRATPTMMALRDGVLVLAEPGALPAEALEELIGTVLKVDMDQVGTQLAAREPPATEWSAR